ncbi:MAG TPA: zf-HC2 domain-containing protein [Thermoanaerobaculia bacterium]|nr:zf-HC2 domain-containing protein [Thermoanaerobaculia bacterium]
MSISCQETRALFALYGAEALDSLKRREMREHLTACQPCRAEAEGTDEGLLFAFAGLEEVTPQEVERVLAGVRAGLDWKRVERRVAPARPFRGRRGFLAAAAALVALTLAIPELSPRPEPSAPTPAKTVRLEPDPSASPVLTQGQPAVLSPSSGTTNGTTPASATIYDWNPGSGQPRVVWIVDRSLDI